MSISLKVRKNTSQKQDKLSKALQHRNAVVLEEMNRQVQILIARLTCFEERFIYQLEKRCACIAEKIKLLEKSIRSQ